MMEPVQTVASGSKLAEAVMAECGQNVNLCFQCGKCAAGCPISYEMDHTPAQLIHAIRLGMDDLVYNSKTMWLCASCETCTTRCPQEVDVAKVMDAVKITAVRKGVKPTIPQVASFYRAALANIKKCGRMYEMGMIFYNDGDKGSAKYWFKKYIEWADPTCKEWDHVNRLVKEIVDEEEG